MIIPAFNSLLYRVTRPALIRHGIKRIFSTQAPPLQQVTVQGISVSDKNFELYLDKMRSEYYALKLSGNLDREGQKRMHQISHLAEMVDQRRVLLNNLRSLDDLKDEKDPEMVDLMKEEQQVYNQILERLEHDIVHEALNIDDDENYYSLMLEVSAGVGGQEAMLFAHELFDMYCNYSLYKGWSTEVADCETSEVGGVRHATVIVEGANAYRCLRHEGGVHRVQRVPATEKSGRIHTSTVSVAIIPKADEYEVEVSEKDLKVETKRASGAGGQHVNTTDSAVRITHIPTGIVVDSQTDRSQHRNRETALRRLKVLLLRRHANEMLSSIKSTRKSQIGTNERNEKIRTYNFNQDRITDHRIEGGTTHNLKGFLTGGPELDAMINKINESARKKRLMEVINKSSH